MIAGELADLKGSLPAGSIADYAQCRDFSTLWTLDYTAILSPNSYQKIPGTKW